MKKNPIYLLMAFAVLALTFNACNKSTDTNPSSQFSTQSDDQTRFTSETDAVTNDADLAIESSVAFSGKSHTNTICDATLVYDSVSTPKTITITYNGTNCSGSTRTRTGVVTLSLAGTSKWTDKDAVLTVLYNNVKVTRIADSKSITLNGTITIINVSGGRVGDLLLNPSGHITHTINSDDLDVTFDDGSHRIWHMARQRDYTYDNGVVVSITGTHTDGTTANICEWGTNRLGKAFSTQVTEPLVLRQDCSFKLGSGKIVHKTLEQSITITFGLTANGSVSSCPGTGGHYNLKVDWMFLTQPYSMILPY
jgi:hypothetical protein